MASHPGAQAYRRLAALIDETRPKAR